MSTRRNYKYSWTYTSDKGLTGPAYCVNWGLNAVGPSKHLEITGRYDRNPQTMESLPMVIRKERSPSSRNSTRRFPELPI